MIKTCPICGKEFESGKNAQKYCSTACRRKAASYRFREKHKRIGVCVWCGKEFETRAANRLYCSEKCGYLARQQKELEAKKSQPLLKGKCVICGKEFETNNPNQILCSQKACHKKYHYIQQKKSDDANRQINRPITETTKMIVGWYHDEDGFTAEQIAAELHRDVKDIKRIFEELGYK